MRKLESPFAGAQNKDHCILGTKRGLPNYGKPHMGLKLLLCSWIWGKCPVISYFGIRKMDIGNYADPIIDVRGMVCQFRN